MTIDLNRLKELRETVPDTIDEDINQNVEIAKALPDILDWIDRAAEAMKGFADAMDTWNQDVEAIIGRQPKTGIGTEHLHAMLEELEDGD